MATSLSTAPFIFAVDDDTDDTDLLRLLLRKAGIANPLQVFPKGEDLLNALSKLAENSLKAIRPLLCFLDLKMPGMNGHDILRWIRTQPALGSVPVVVLSSSEHPEDIKQAVQNGAHCYLTKYPQPAVLKEIVDDAARFAVGAPASECFRIPENLLLVRCRRLNDAVA